MAKIANIYEEGNYTCDAPIQVVLELSAKNVISESGKVISTMATWTNKGNILKFTPGERVYLDAKLLKNVSIQNLINFGKIRRTL